MDTKTLVKKLHELFSSENKSRKKYIKVWLTRVILLGFYNTKTYELNVLFRDRVANSYKESELILSLLKEKIKGSLGIIDSIGVHYIEDGFYNCQENDLLVYEAVDTA